MTTEQTNDPTPLQQAEAYFTECVIIASETESDLDRKNKFENAKMTTIKLLNYNIDD